VMEYVEGKTLEDVIADGGALDASLAVTYSQQICRALDHAHRQGVIHRDLRPPNVLVSHAGVLKVADFGTSRFLEIAAHSTTVIGSPPYMAPEQFDGKAVFASDLYSLGVTMYQMLTGELPYDAPAPGDLDKLRRGDLVSPPRLRQPSIPKPLSDIVMTAMAPDISNRYQRADDLLRDLEGLRTASGRSRQASAEPVGARNSEASGEVNGIRRRLRDRVVPEARFCWQCRKPLHARSDRCPFCSESQ
jgi:serine/threonine protein kinase